MRGGRFLVSLREVLNTERILKCRSLIKEDIINFWKEDLKPIPEDYEDEKLNLIERRSLNLCEMMQAQRLL